MEFEDLNLFYQAFDRKSFCDLGKHLYLHFFRETFHLTGTVNVISSDNPCKYSNARFTTLPFMPLNVYRGHSVQCELNVNCALRVYRYILRSQIFKSKYLYFLIIKQFNFLKRFCRLIRKSPTS